MSNYNQSNLARLRPDKPDDASIQQQISLIQQACQDVDPDIIAMIFYECDYNLHNTIERIKAGDYQDGGWQTATKSNHKKKSDQNFNGGIQSDSERSLSQRTSPTSSLRNGINGRRRQEQYPHERRGVSYFDRKPLSTNKSPSNNPTTSISSVKPPPPPPPENFPVPATNTSVDDDMVQLLEKKPTKRRVSSSIPQEPVSMHRTIQFSTEPIDIQFGDIQWKNSIPIKVTPSTSPTLEDQLTDVQNSSSLNSINPETTNECNRKLSEITTQLSSSSISNNNDNNPSILAPLDDTSHLSDRLINSSQEHSTTPIPTHMSDTLQSSNTSSGFHQPSTVASPNNITQEYSQTSLNSKTNSKPTMMQTGNYSQQTSYSMPSHQQFFVGPYPYQTPMYPVLTTPMEAWSTAGYEPYPTYTTPNYMSAYATQQPYHSSTIPPVKYDSHGYDKEFFANYGQTRSSNPDLSNSSQTTKDSPRTSKLSATAASFSQAVPLTATSPTATTFLLNPHLYTTFPAYYQLLDNRDNRNGASYPGHPNRTHYQQQQQQQPAYYRTHPNSNWHSQQ